VSIDAANPSVPANLLRTLRLWVDFDQDGIVRMRTGKVELGQGIVTAIAQIAAEELDVAYERIRPFALDTALSPNEGSTTGSRSIQEGGEGMRRACAAVRTLFLQAAARRMQVPAESIDIADGTFRSPKSDAQLTYWQMAGDVDLDQPLPSGHATCKEPGSFKLVGQALPRLDIEAKLRGGAFIQDIVLPGMLHGRIVRPPSPRARLVSVEEGAVRAMPGVRELVCRGSFVGVIAEREEQAIRAMQRLQKDCRWEEQACLPDMNALPAWLCEQPAEREVLCAERPDAPVHGVRLAATFTRPYIAHASISPSCGLAWWRGDKVEAWSHSQSIFELRKEMARVLVLDPEQIIVRHAEAGGCYGQNGADDATFDAVLLAQAVRGTPVRVQWMREDEFAWEPLGPPMVVKLAATVGPDGRVAEWDEEIYGNRHIGRPGRLARPALLAAWHFDQDSEPPLPVDMPLQMGGGGQRNAVPCYDFPKHVVNNAVLETPLRVSALRALGAHLNVCAIESFMDELAHAAGVDPVEFRLRHLADERARAVIEAAARRAGWQPGSRGDGSSGWGMGFARYKNISTYAAVFAQVVLQEQVRVTRVVAAVDCGCIVNPDGLLNQCEGGVIQAISWALKEEMRFDDTRVTGVNWEDYPILRFSEVPVVDIELINRPDEPSLGAGEGMTGPTAAAISNAIFNAMGVRVRDMPFTFERIAAAMDAA
jgi:nicotinate dehydrogenase subunit B